MKKYTVIYGEFFNRGSQSNSITKYKHIECRPADLKDTVETVCDWGNVWFVFDGHCEQTND